MFVEENMKNYKLLIYEDPEKREFIYNYLISIDHPVKVAGSVNEAFEMLRNERFDVILTDQLFAKNTMNRIYREIKRMHPSILIIWIDIDKTHNHVPERFSGTSIDYFSKIMRILGNGNDDVYYRENLSAARFS